MKRKTDKNEYGRFETLNYWQQKGLPALNVSPPARHVWHVLWGRADTLGVVVISFGQIAHETGWSKRSCIRCVNELIEKKIIKLHIRGNSKNMANTYALILKKKEKG